MTMYEMVLAENKRLIAQLAKKEQDRIFWQRDAETLGSIQQDQRIEIRQLKSERQEALKHGGFVPWTKAMMVTLEGIPKKALDLIEQYGDIDGAHHKQWLIDQIVQCLTDDYGSWVSEYGHTWDTGIAP